MTTIDVSDPPTHCPDCAARGVSTLVSPDNWEQLRPGGMWLLAEGACSKCEDIAATSAREEMRKRGLERYRESVPKKYRPLADGGRTDLTCDDWKEHKGAAQVAFLRGWKRHEKPFAGVIGPGGICKSRAVAILARDLAVMGRRILWVNGTNLSWCGEHQKRGGFETKAKAYNSLKEMRDADVLILDDLWKGADSVSYHTVLYDLLEYRGSREKTMLWTANTHPSDFPNIPADIRDPLVGRILEDSHYLNLFP